MAHGSLLQVLVS